MATPMIHPIRHGRDQRDPFCTACVQEAAREQGLHVAGRRGTALRDDGSRVHWMAGDYVDPVLIARDDCTDCPDMPLDRGPA